MTTTDEDYDRIAAALEGVGWCLLPDFLDATTVAALAAECRAFDATAALRYPACAGTAQSRPS